MIRTITISGIDCRMKSSAAIPRMYRLKFRRDIMVDMQKLSDHVEEGKDEDGNSYLEIQDLEMFENIAYLFNKHGDPSQPDTVEEWLDQFEFLDIYEVLPQLIEMWGMENAQMSTRKK